MSLQKLSSKSDICAVGLRGTLSAVCVRFEVQATAFSSSSDDPAELRMLMDFAERLSFGSYETHGVTIYDAAGGWTSGARSA